MLRSCGFMLLLLGTKVQYLYVYPSLKCGLYYHMRQKIQTPIFNFYEANKVLERQ